MSKLDDRLAERRRQATEAAQAVTRPPVADPPGTGAREDTPAGAPAPTPAAVRPAKPARTPVAAEATAEVDKDALAGWRWRLGATAGKAAAAQRRANEAARAWERVVADARDAGVPERLLMAAALEADVDLPAGE